MNVRIIENYDEQCLHLKLEDKSTQTELPDEPDLQYQHLIDSLQLSLIEQEKKIQLLEFELQTKQSNDARLLNRLIRMKYPVGFMPLHTS